MQIPNRLFLIIVLLLPIGVHAQIQGNPDITTEELRQHVYRLASEEWQGRKTGEPGADSAAVYIREQLRQAGVTLLGDDGFQSFSLPTAVEPSVDCALTIASWKGTLDSDFRPLAFSGNGSLKAPVVWAGYGFDFEKDATAWKDYEGLDVAGKWVMILRGSPDDKSGDYDPFAPLRIKAMTAHEKGAAGVLFVSGPLSFPSEDLVPLMFRRQDAALGIPVISISRQTAERLLDGYTIADLETTLRNELQPLRVECVHELEGVVELLPQSILAHNVVGMVRGSDPALAEEYIVIGAHYDHLGMGGPGSGSRRPDTIAVHYGADDNASGVAAVLEIIERIAHSAGNFKRSVIAALFTAEEMGLIGAKEFTRNSPVDLKSIRLMCNLDMVGRMDSLRSLSIGGTGTAEGLEDMLRDISGQHGIRPSMSPQGFGPSDHAAFYAEDIPVLFFFTGAHDDYHTPLDRADKLNYEGKKILADFIYDIVADIANRPAALTFTEAGPKSRAEGSPRFKVTLGIMPDVSSGDGKGLRADAVVKGRPADIAGMQKGDVIVSMEGKPVTGVYDYMSRLAEFEQGQRISIEVLRGEERIVLIVEL
jgi:aminopeptidase YwaD